MGGWNLSFRIPLLTVRYGVKDGEEEVAQWPRRQFLFVLFVNEIPSKNCNFLNYPPNRFFQTQWRPSRGRQVNYVLKTQFD